MSETLELRGARYFGWHDKPRTTIRLNNKTVLIVGRQPDRLVLMHYSEEIRPTGTFVRLTDRALSELVEALTAINGAPGVWS